MPHPAPAHKSFADRNSLYQEIADKIIAELEHGRVPWVQPWSSKAAGAAAPIGLPRNAATGRSYTGINVLILWIAATERGFTQPRWLTFRQALKLKAHVRKGERGTTLVYADRFIPYRERTRAAEAGDDPQAIPFLKRFTVFNIATSAKICRPTLLRHRRRSTTPSSCRRPRRSSARPVPTSASAATAPSMCRVPITFRCRRSRPFSNQSTGIAPSAMNWATGPERSTGSTGICPAISVRHRMPAKNCAPK
jgi:N-terminal domain of anti-restriction factor ArdC